MTTASRANVAWRESPEVVRAQHRARRVLVASQVFGSIGVSAAFTVGVLLAEQVTTSEAWAGLARTSSTVGAAAASLPLAILAARAGRRRALSTGWLIALAGAGLLVLAGSTDSTVLLIVGMLAFGVGSAVGLQARFAATDLATPARTSSSLAVVVWAGTVGSVLGPNLGTPGRAVESALGLPTLTGAFVISAIAIALLLLLLRPDPLLEAQRHEGLATTEADVGPGAVPAGRATGGIRLALRAIWQSPTARLAFIALALAHAAMVGVMTMTPVHMHYHGTSLEVVGLVISGHVLGMFAFSPVVGWLADRIGRVAVILVGQAILVASALAVIVVGEHTAPVTVALFLLGLGWSFVTVPASAAISEGVADDVRPLAQGAADTSMNVIAALAAAISGPLMLLTDFTALNWGVVVLVAPVVWLAARLPRSPSSR